MATTTGLTYEQLQAKIDALKKQGKSSSTSKEYGKYVNAQMLLKPAGFGSDALKNAQAQIKMSTQTPAGTSGSSAMSSGSSGLGTPSGSPASIDLNKIYESAMTSPELVALEKQLADKKTARTTAETNINDNPWYSEATRVGKIAKLTDQSQREISDIESQVAQKKADAQVKVNIASQQYNIEDKNYQNQLQKLNLLISSGALLNASGTDVASIATATGMSTSMVNGMISQMKENKIKPTVSTDTDDNGNVTVSIFDANTGKIISQNSLGAVGKAQNGGGGGGGTPTTNKYLTSATKYLAEADTALTGKGTEDKLLSADEQMTAYNKILALVGGNTTLAQQVFQQAWDTGGYDNYGQ
jgi:hypothetical protein